MGVTSKLKKTAKKAKNSAKKAEKKFKDAKKQAVNLKKQAEEQAHELKEYKAKMKASLKESANKLKEVTDSKTFNKLGATALQGASMYYTGNPNTFDSALGVVGVDPFSESSYLDDTGLMGLVGGAMSGTGAIPQNPADFMSLYQQYQGSVPSVPVGLGMDYDIDPNIELSDYIKSSNPAIQMNNMQMVAPGTNRSGYNPLSGNKGIFASLLEAFGF